jgi:hypothetical protein
VQGLIARAADESKHDQARRVGVWWVPVNLLPPG